MSEVTSEVVSQGGSIHLNYAPGGVKGISNPVTMGLVIHVLPPGDIPNVIITLELPGEQFTFGNSLSVLPKDMGYLGDGRPVNIQFTIICNSDDPPSTMAMIVHTRDNYDDPVDHQYVTYSVKREESTAGNVQMLFLSN